MHDNAVKGNKTNIVIAAFTTCHARLKLYESLDALQVSKSFTMISIVWCTNGAPVNPFIATGDFLGDMTDELDGDVVTEFVSAGAKNYGYMTRERKVICNVCRFTLNVRG